MNRDTVVQHVTARDKVIVWTASDFDRYWVYKPGKDCVEAIDIRGPVSAAIQDIAKEEGLSGGVWVRGLAGIAGLFPLIFRDSSVYFCRRCSNDFHDADDTAEWRLLAKLDRGMTQDDFGQLHVQLTHPKRQNESVYQPPVTMTAEEAKDVHQTATRHFEEDRNELRAAPRAVVTFSACV
jgi:hypothetical protein